MLARAARDGFDALEGRPSELAILVNSLTVGGSTLLLQYSYAVASRRQL